MDSPPAYAPETFGKYTLLEPVGAGGMAEIFLAREGEAGPPVVIKRVLAEYTEEKRFLEMLVSEAKLAALLDHPAIVRLHELGKEAGQLYLAMEYVPGWDLDKISRAAGLVPAPVAARIALKIAEALAYAHRCTDLQGRPLNVVHRDVTPSNIMVTREGEVKLIDFGVAKATTQLNLTRAGVVKGKWRFLSPEQIQQKALDGRSDLFSLGVALYEISVGRALFARKSFPETLKAILHEAPPRPSKVVPGYPPRLEEVVLTALAKDRELRYPDAEAMAEALREALASMPGPSDPGNFVRELAAARQDELPPLAVDRHWHERPARRNTGKGLELTLVNVPALSGPGPTLRSPTPRPRGDEPPWVLDSGLFQPPRASRSPRRQTSRPGKGRAGKLAGWLGFALLALAAAAGTWFALSRLAPRHAGSSAVTTQHP